MSPDAVWLRTICAQNGIVPTDDQLDHLSRFAERILEWNKSINLISRRDEENIWSNHILHSLSLLFKVEIPGGVNILDLGTGGGLPGIPLKIVRPDLRFTLLDSTQKKIAAVKDIVEYVGLGEVGLVWGRAEEVGKEKAFSHQFDIVVARAVAPLKDLVRWSIPLLNSTRDGGGPQSDVTRSGVRPRIAGPALIAFKGGDVTEEIRQARNNAQIHSIAVLDLTLRGSTQMDEGEKKIVILNFNRSKESGAKK